MGKDKSTSYILGKRFGRSDLERCDLFVDPGFLQWGRYEPPVVLNEAAQEGAQMHAGGPSGGKKKCGIHQLSGYFDPEFRTISVKEPYVEKWRLTGRPPPHPLKGPWIPCHPASKHATPGDNYGTFTTEHEAFSPVLKEEYEQKKPKEPINFLTNPGKKGNCGYADIGINKYPPHTVHERVDHYLAPNMLYADMWKKHKSKIRNGPFKAGFYPRYFDENPYKDTEIRSTYVERPQKQYGTNRGLFYPPAAPKRPGNNHDGCFTKFPSWQADPYMTAVEAEKLLSKNRTTSLVFRPEPRMKTYYTLSVMNNKVDIACNERTWRTMKPITYPQFNL